MSERFRSGFVSLLGRPNSGKSTLLNALVGQKVAIVADKPQTTRTAIQGVVTLPDAQIVFVDTPGIHKADSPLNKRLMNTVRHSIEDRDLLLFVADAARKFAEEDRRAIDMARRTLTRRRTPAAATAPTADAADTPTPTAGPPAATGPTADATDTPTPTAGPPAVTASTAGPADTPTPATGPPAATAADPADTPTPVLLVLNKVDLLKDKSLLLPLIEEYKAVYEFADYVPVSALKNLGLDELRSLIVERLPEGPAFFPEDYVTDQPERFLAAELIREKVLLATRQEVPHSVTVMVDRWEATPQITHIYATIRVERDGQKAIVIGAGGAMLKQIGTLARHEMEAVFGVRIYLELHVRVEPGWREKRAFLNTLDWRTMAGEEDDR